MYLKAYPLLWWRNLSRYKSWPLPFLTLASKAQKKMWEGGKKNHQFSSETSRRMSRNIRKAFVLLQFLKSCRLKSVSGGVKSVFFCLFFFAKVITGSSTSNRPAATVELGP